MRIISLAMIVLGLVGVVRGEEMYGERWRPQFHFTPAKNWNNDPNGLVYFDGEYHLFYQYNPFGDQWGHMSWGHAVSRDLVRWEELAVAIPEEGGVMAFSGSAVVDWKNTSGWGKNGEPAMVAIYTGHRPKDGHQFQCVAYSNDHGRNWVRVGTVLDIGSTAFRDPKVSWDEARGRWVMVVALSDERRVRFYTSVNLREWEFTGEFGPTGSVEGAWECPDLFAMDGKWVLTVNVSGGGPAGGSTGQYFVGEFDGRRFRQTGGTGWLDYGPDCYAAVSYSGVPGGRRVMMGWMTSLRYAGATPTAPWRGGMTVAREVKLEGGRLVQGPVRELEGLRGMKRVVGGTIEKVNEAIKDVRAEGRDIEVEFEAREAARFGLNLGGVVIGYDVKAGEVIVDRTKSGEVGFNPGFAGVYRMPVKLSEGRVKWRVLVDASSVEIFADGKVVTALVFPKEEGRLSVWGEGALVREMTVWEMGSAWQKR